MSFLTAARAGVALSTRAASWSNRLAEQTYTPQFDAIDASVELELSGGENVVVTAEQSAQIADFVALPAITTLLRLNLLRQLCGEEDFVELEPYCGQEAFQGFVDSWCALHSLTWAGLGSELWTVICGQQRRLAQQLVDRGLLNDAEQDVLVGRFLFGAVKSNGIAPVYLRSLEGLAASPERQLELNSFIHENRSHNRVGSDSFLIQGIEESTALFETLYVDRTLIDATTGQEMSASDQLDIVRANPRTVIVGNPGVGKTTLMAWLRWKLSIDDTGPLAVTLLARHRLAQPKSNVLHELKAQIESDFQCELSPTLFTDLLATGWIVLIVDGVDEILHEEQRANVVDQLHTFAQRYPVVSILCTTRRTGFEVGLFQASVFRTVNLEEYSDAEVEVYVQRWFGSVKSEVDKAPQFLGESRSLVELRRNPLILALLCTLYRQNDYIPRSRRDLYLRCAALMFHEWDPRRGIAIPNLFKSEGENVLREIALLLHSIGGVGQTIQERQLVHLVTVHLVNKGEQPLQANAAARNLLEYCSGRAWILSRVGTSAGEPAFAFTHRTFFEFFAAEGIVRKINRASNLFPDTRTNSVPGLTLSPLAGEIYKAFQADSTSVMPELLLQSGDDLMGGIGSSVLQEILQTSETAPNPEAASRLSSLAVRLVSAIGVTATVADDILRRMLVSWEAQMVQPPAPLSPLPGREVAAQRRWEDQANLTEFRNVLDLPASHRARFMDMISTRREWALAFLARFARLDFLREAGLFAESWRTGALALFNSYRRDISDPLVWAFANDYGQVPIWEFLRSVQGVSLLQLSYENRTQPGPLWLSIHGWAASTELMHAWQGTLPRLISAADIHVRGGESYVEMSMPIFAAAVFPEELALALGLLVPADQLERLQLVTRTSQWLPVATLARQLRRAVDAAEEAKVDVDKVKARARRELGSLYRQQMSTSTPSWLREYVGIGRAGSHTLAWK